MRIAVFNLKGGVGKTPIAFSLAKDLGMNIQSNDSSLLETLYPGRAKITKTPKLEDNTVYDFGGFLDTSIIPILKASNVVIIPCKPDGNSILKTCETIDGVRAHNQTIIVVVTQTESEDDYIRVMKELGEFFDGLNFFELRKSKVFTNSMDTGKSVTELYNESPLSKSAYKTVYAQYNTILELFK